MATAREPEHVSGPDDFARQFDVSRETLDRLKLYADLLTTWQKTINLVAPATLPDLWQRHMADSAQLVAHIPADAHSLIDLGSGGGFPGLVLAIMFADRPGFRATLVESDQRKAAFLREVARQSAIAVDILSTRIEAPETHAKVRGIDVVTARALAPLDRLLGWSVPYHRSDTIGLFLKGRDAEAEVETASVRWSFEVALRPSLTEPDARIVIVRRLKAKGEG